MAGCIIFALNFDPMQKDWAILHQDTAHAVVLKPAGMAVHGRGQHTLTAQLKHDIRFSDADPWQHVHRLDYGTRGPGMFAKTQAAQKALLAESVADWMMTMMRRVMIGETTTGKV